MIVRLVVWSYPLFGVRRGVNDLEKGRESEKIFFFYLEDDGSNPGRLIAKLEVPFVVEYIGFSEDIGHAEFNASIIIALKLIEFKIFFFIIILFFFLFISYYLALISP